MAHQRLTELTVPTGASDPVRLQQPNLLRQLRWQQQNLRLRLAAHFQTPPSAQPVQLRWYVPPSAGKTAAALLLVLLLAASCSLWQPAAGPNEMPLTAPTATTESITIAKPQTTSTLAPSPVTAAEELLTIAVVGAVAHPGLKHFPPGARVADALEQAQVLPEADTRSLNLAQKLTDEMQLLVPTSGEAPVPPAPLAAGVPTASGKVRLNSATAAELETLHGVGPATAAAIIAHREAIGGFETVEQLAEVRGIGPARLAALAPQLSL